MLPWSLIAATNLIVAIHSFYDSRCCGDEARHCHPVMCNEIQPLPDGWSWQGILFTRQMLHKAPDGACHVCTHHINIGEPEQPLCIYLPPQS